MDNRFLGVLAVILMASSTCPSEEKPGGKYGVATITGEIRDPSSREIAFAYQQPSGRRLSHQRAALDSLDHFVLALPVTRGSHVWVSYDGGKPRWEWLRRLGAFLFDYDRLVLFVEPGDSLHVVAEEGLFGASYSFSGPSADNNRFFAEWVRRPFSFRPDYKGLQVEDFSRQVEQWRRDQLEFLAEGRERYTLSPGFVEYAIYQIKYQWAGYMLSYPMNYRFANEHENRDITPEYYDFLEEVPLVDAKAIGVESYRTYVERVLGRELREASEAVDRSGLSDIYDLSGLELSDEILARLDSIYEEEGRRPRLSKIVDLSAVGLSPTDQARLDSVYAKKRLPRLSQQFDLSAFGLSETAQAALDSFYEKSRSYSITSSSKEEVPRIDTTDGVLAFYLPLEVPKDSLAKEWPKLSERLDLSKLSESGWSRLDSMYENRKPLKLSEKLDLAELGLSEAAQARADSIYGAPWSRIGKSWFEKLNDLAREKLEGRVLYWFLAGRLIDGFAHNVEAFAEVRGKWEDFQQINPYPEYSEAVQAALDKALKVLPGRPAPDFTLHDLEGQPVSLSQFKGRVVLLDFWASWCGPCIADLPRLKEIKERMAARQVVFVNLSLDGKESDWRKAVEGHGIQGVHVRAPGWGAEVAKAYNVSGIPSYFLVDPKGMIVERLAGGVGDVDGVVAKIEKTLGRTN